MYVFIFGGAGSLMLLGYFSSCGKWGLLSSHGVPELLIAVLLLLWSSGFRGAGVRSCVTWAQGSWLPSSRAQAQ